MFNPSLLNRATLKDTPHGRLVMCAIERKHHVGMVVDAPAEDDEKGVLFLPPVSLDGSNKAAPLFGYPGDGRLIDLGCSPEFAWSGQFDSISGPEDQIPPVGHLIVAKGVVYIGGRVQRGPGGTTYWDVSTGKLSKNQSVAALSATFVSDWRAGWRDLDHKFHELARFPAQ